MHSSEDYTEILVLIVCLLVALLKAFTTSLQLEGSVAAEEQEQSLQ